MRKILVRIALVLGLIAGVIGAVPGSPAPVASAAETVGWYVESYNVSGGSVIHWVRDANHHTMDRYIGGVYVGNVLDIWLPAAVTFTLFAASGSTDANIRFCITSGYNYKSLGETPWDLSTGWQGTFKFNHYDGSYTNEGVYHFLRSGSNHYVFSTKTHDNTCASGKLGYRRW